MGCFIIKLDDRYLEWSTIVDAPVTEGMALPEFEAYYRHLYGSRGMDGLPQRLARVDANGSSAINPLNVDDLIAGNRAGPGESCLTRDEIVEFYVRRREEPTEEALREYREKREGKT